MTNSFKTTLLAAAFALSLAACDSTPKAENATADEDTAVLVRTGETAGDKVGDMAESTSNGFDDLDFNLPEVNLGRDFEDISFRGNERYGYYDLGENILFETDKADLSAKGKAKLMNIVSNVNERYSGGKVRIYGFTDPTGSADYNKELSEQRAQSVKSWLSTDGKMDDQHMSIQAMGERNPIPGNNAASRRVVIVAKKD